MNTIIERITEAIKDILIGLIKSSLDNMFTSVNEQVGTIAGHNIINLRLDITHLYYPAKNSFQKGRLKRREIFTELLLYTLTT